MVESRRVPRRPLTSAAPLARRPQRLDAEPAARPLASPPGGEVALMRVLFVVPAFNEERALPAVIGELRSEATTLGIDADVVIVDDGSGDRTSEVAASGGARG